MNTASMMKAFNFPPRRSTHYAQWAPVYIEPVVGSGERLCIAIAVADDKDSFVYAVPGIERLTCVYGPHANALVAASQLIIGFIQRQVARHSVSSLADWPAPMEGVFFGIAREGAGVNLEDIALTAAMQCASLARRTLETENISADGNDGETSSRLDTIIKDAVLQERPEFAKFFGRSFKASENARAAHFGFAGHKLVANFGLLVPNTLSTQVRNAKAKLWDLKQLKSGAMSAFLDEQNIIDFELLLHRLPDNEPSYTDRQVISLQEAVLELEQEADKVEVRCKPMYSAGEIAKYVLAKEAA
jgi:hypothetical protein